MKNHSMILRPQACGKELQVWGRLIRMARLAAEGFEFLTDPEAAVDELRRSDARVDVFTFTQQPPDVSPKFNYPIEWDNIAALRVSTFDEWFRSRDGKVRNKVRLSEKRGVTVREVPFDDALVSGISAIYNESPVRQGKPFWHYNKDLETVRKENGTFLDRSVFIGAFFEDRLIGFAKLVSDEKQQQASVMQIVSMLRHHDKAPTNALIAQAVRSCSTRGLPYLVYAKFIHANRQPDSLSDFKHHNGFERIDLPRYYVPLTRAGWLAVRLGLHREFRDCLPEPVFEAARKIRARWSAATLLRAPEAT
jgi:hypothetical protein